MKKLGKLSINPEKIIKNEELVNLRGGYDGYGEDYDFACCTTSGNNLPPYCDTYELIQAWAAYWITAGYTVDCDRVYYV